MELFPSLKRISLVWGTPLCTMNDKQIIMSISIMNKLLRQNREERN